MEVEVDAGTCVGFDGATAFAGWEAAAGAGAGLDGATDGLLVGCGAGGAVDEFDIAIATTTLNKLQFN